MYQNTTKNILHQDMELKMYIFIQKNNKLKK